MLTLTTEDAFVIEGRGVAYTLHMPKGHNPRELPDTEIVLDGCLAKVIAVETFAMPDGPWLFDGPPVGLLVAWAEARPS